MVDLTNIFLFVATGYMAILSWMGNREVKRVDKLEEAIQAHEKRIQSTEDIQGTKLETLEKKIDKIEAAIETLAANIHKEKNQEGQLTAAITALLRHLESNEK